MRDAAALFLYCVLSYLHHSSTFNASRWSRTMKALSCFNDSCGFPCADAHLSQPLKGSLPSTQIGCEPHCCTSVVHFLLSKLGLLCASAKHEMYKTMVLAGNVGPLEKRWVCTRWAAQMQAEALWQAVLNGPDRLQKLN